MKYLIFLLISFVSYSQVIPGAVGWGADWVFPSNYEVYIVTNLANSGVGSFRDACESTIPVAFDSRIIVFNGLSGTIALNLGDISPSNTKPIYIAGQTSQNGILLTSSSYNGALMRVNANVTGFIMRGLTFAVGEGGMTSVCCRDNFDIGNGTNYYISENTFVWSVDESLGLGDATHVTFANNLISESLSLSVHAEGEHSKSTIITNNADKISFFQNLFKDNVDRNPLIGGGSPGPPLDEFELSRNVIYNWDNFGLVVAQGPKSVNIIDNISISGAATSPDRYAFAFDETDATVFALGNRDDTYRTLESDAEFDAVGCQSCSGGVYMRTPLPIGQRRLTPFAYPMANLPDYTKQQVLDTVYTFAGDVNDAGGITSRNKSDFLTRKGGIIDDPVDVGGYPTITAGTIITDTDGDGIPDSQEAIWGNDTFGYVNSIIGSVSPPITLNSLIRKKNSTFTGVN